MWNMSAADSRLAAPAPPLTGRALVSSATLVLKTVICTPSWAKPQPTSSPLVTSVASGELDERAMSTFGQFAKPGELFTAPAYCTRQLASRAEDCRTEARPAPEPVENRFTTA